MITFNILTLLLLLNNRVGYGQYLLAEYAPNHDNYRPAHYHFAYGVSDPSTGDHKHHWEKRQGDHVVGEYGLLEPDGATRIVQYTADPHHGFQAVVTRIENSHAIQHQYTSGNALYGTQHSGLFNEANVVQFGQHQQHQQHGLTAVNPKAFSNLPIHDNQYYLNQYAGGFQQNVAPQHVVVQNNGHDGHFGSVSSTIAPFHEQQRPVVVQNTYSTLGHQPNYDAIQPEHRGGDLPLHVIENLKNQYGGNRQEQVEPRGFAYNLEGNVHNTNAQSINALQENPGHQQVFVTSTERPSQHFVSSTPQTLQGDYISSTPNNLHDSGVQYNAQNNYQQNFVSSTESPVQHNYVSSTQSSLEYASTPSPIDHSGSYASSTPNSIQQNYISSTQSPMGYVSSTPSPLGKESFHHNYPTDVQIIPNGQNVLPEAQIPLINQHQGETQDQMNPLLKNLVSFLRNHMPEQYKERLETMFKPYIETPLGKIVPNFQEGVVSSTPNPQQVFVTSTERPETYVSKPNHGYVSSTPHQGYGSSTPSQGYVSSPPNIQDSGAYVSSTPSNLHGVQGYVPSIPANLNEGSLNAGISQYNGGYVSSTVPSVQPALQGISQYQNNPYLNGEININPNPQSSKQDYAQNPYVNGEIAVGQIPKSYLAPGVTPTPDYPQNSQVNYAQERVDSDYQDYRGDANNYGGNYNARKIYYELNPTGYQGDYQGNSPGNYQNLRRDTSTQTQQQGKNGTVFAVTNENGRNLQTPNFYQPVHPNMYPDNPFPKLDQSGATTNDFIWNAGDYSAPLDPEGNILVRQLNQTCASFRFNTTNDYEQKDQDIHVWNSGDYSALRAEEQLIRSVNVTCNNFTNDYTNNLTSGFSLWQYCSQCLNSDAQDVNIVQTETIVGPDGEPREIITSNTQQQQIANNPDHYFQDSRSNGEIAGLIKVYNPNLQKPSTNNFVNLLNSFNAEVQRRKPIYVPNFEEGDYDYSDNTNNGVNYNKRNVENNNEGGNRFVVLVKKPVNA